MKTYARAILGLYVLVASAIIGAGLWLQPLTGDLTRTGGYAENDFGWNGVQFGLDRRLFALGRRDDYDRYYDVVVFGDSFSRASFEETLLEPGPASPPFASWNNFFANDTGLSMVVFRIEDFEDIVDSRQFKASPPRLIVYETIEREFVTATAGSVDPYPVGRNPAKPLFERKPLGLEPVPFSRQRHYRGGVLEFGDSVTFLKGALTRFTGVGRGLVQRFELTTDALFTNDRAGELLVWYQDLVKVTFTRDELRQGYRKLLAWQNDCQRSGKTLFWTRGLPVKKVDYQQFLAEPEEVNQFILDREKPPPELNLPPFADNIFAAVQRREADVYMPNDTHLSWQGDKIVSDTLVEYLTSEGYLATSSPGEP